jgi:hypothetical protein
VIQCVSIFDHDRLQTTVGPADVAADALRVCPMASDFGFADHVIIIIMRFAARGRRVGAAVGVPGAGRRGGAAARGRDGGTAAAQSGAPRAAALAHAPAPRSPRALRCAHFPPARVIISPEL